jgi:glutamine synthetase
MTRDEIVATAAREGVRLIRFLYCDNGGVIRGKTTHVEGLADRLETGIGLTVAMQAMSLLDHLAVVEGMGPVGEVRLVPDPATFTVLPYAPRSASLHVEMRELDGSPWGACPRHFLHRQIGALATKGMQLKAAWEVEFSLAVPEGTAFRPADESLCFSTVGMTTAAAFMDEVVTALEAQGVGIEQYYPELGHGQQELSVRHAPAMAAVDNHLRVRETIRSVARRHGFVASLAPKPFAHQAGNGAHLHFSLWDAAGERNLFFDDSDRYSLSRLGYQFIGGVLAHLPALLALTCPSVNSYRRLGPQRWSSAFVCFGPDNREAAIRIASPFRGREAASVNLELKACDNSCNPYLALGGLIAAGLDGIERGIDPGEPVLVDPAALTAAERDALGIAAFPADLGAALDALEQDTLLRDALGELLGRAFLAVKRSEAADFEAEDEAFELRHHFEKY